MIISEKHLRKVIREIIIESDGEATSYEVVRDEVEAKHNRPESPDQVTTDQVTTDEDDTGSYDIYLPPYEDDTDVTNKDITAEYTRLLNPENTRINPENTRNRLTSFSTGQTDQTDQTGQTGHGLQSLINTNKRKGS